MSHPSPRCSRRRFLRTLALGAGAATLGGASVNLMSAGSPRFPVSDHCDGRRFFNPRIHDNRTFLDVLKWKTTSKVAAWPEWVEITPHPLPEAPAGDGLAVTWVNHATFLLQTRHGNVLTDPVWSKRVSPLHLIGPKRVHAPGVSFETLPRIDVVLLTHDHYDHCDLPTLRRLARRRPQPLAITPLGNGELLRAAGFASAQVIELDWWEAHEISDGFTVRATPARHWSNRASGRRNHRLWSGFFLQAGRRTAHFVGDTAYDDQMFRDIQKRCGAPDLALIPIGAYEPRWFMSAAHCNPAEAVQIHHELGARLSLAMHWGTWQLTDEAREAPLTALAAALAARAVPERVFRALAPGESMTV
ncbi:MAG TPA: MBL fold metallo-hydrolase [Opitutaceae bacterium]